MAQYGINFDSGTITALDVPREPLPTVTNLEYRKVGETEWRTLPMDFVPDEGVGYEVRTSRDARFNADNFMWFGVEPDAAKNSDSE